MPLSDPVHISLYDMNPLRMSEKLFYQIGLSVDEAENVLDMHVEKMREFARYILAHVHAAVLGDRRALVNAKFIASLKLRDTAFDPAAMRARWEQYSASEEMHQWKNLDPWVLESFIPDHPVAEQAMASNEP